MKPTDYAKIAPTCDENRGRLRIPADESAVADELAMTRIVATRR